jgi:hypothetical protein
MKKLDRGPGCHEERGYPSRLRQPALNLIDLPASRAPRWKAGIILMAAFVLIQVPILVGRSTRPGFPVIRGPYLGERAPRDRAELFAPGIVSTRHHEHSSLAIRPDGREMFWTVASNNPAGSREQKIWHTRENEGVWSEPTQMDVPLAGTRSPILTPDGKELYFLSDDPDSGPAGTPPRSMVWVKRAVGDSWTEAVPVPNLLPRVKNQRTMSFCFAANGNLYFDLGGPDSTGQWEWRIYCSEMKNRTRLQPRPIGDGINVGSVNFCPYVAPNESYLIFASNREGGLGDDDLYISFRTSGGRWTPPLNMGPKVNTPAPEGFPSVSPDGHFLFFGRHNYRTLQDYYWIDAQIIQNLKLDYALNAPPRG